MEKIKADYLDASREFYNKFGDLPWWKRESSERSRANDRITYNRNYEIMRRVFEDDKDAKRWATFGGHSLYEFSPIKGNNTVIKWDIDEIVKWPQFISRELTSDDFSYDSFMRYPCFFPNAIAKEQDKRRAAQQNIPKPTNYQAYLNSYAKLDPKPQTYAEELPHRPQLRELGVQFEPYPNALKSLNKI